MTVRVEDPSGGRWTVRRGVVRGRDARGWRWRWRGPDPGWLEALRITDLADLAEIPVVGVAVVAVIAVVVVALLVVFLPFVALGLIEALLLGVLVVGFAAASTLFGRPILVRAERMAASASPGTSRRERARVQPGDLVWAVQGWGASKRVRDLIVETLRSGGDPTMVVGADGVLLADRRS